LKLSEELNHNRYCAELLDLGIPFANRLENAIAYSIFFQYFALNMALRKGLVQPAFLENKELLQISNRMIYFD